MRSHLLEGVVRHRRARPTTYGLEHGVYYFAIDLGELDDVIDGLRLVSRGRANIVSFHDHDHLSPPATDLPTDLRTHLRTQGIAADGWSVTLVTSLRVLGYVFNPASFFLCRDERGTLRVVVVEVHNTYGERHLYTLRRIGDDGPFVSSMDKAFFVSPFIEMDARYAVHVRDDEDGLRIAIAERQDGAPLLSTSLVLRRVPLNDRNVLRMLRPLPAPAAADDRPDPLARVPSLAARRPVPSPSRSQAPSRRSLDDAGAGPEQR